MPSTAVRTFHARRGRLGPELRSALDLLLPRYGIDPEEPVVPGALFNPPLPVVLEIGFGMGDATVHMAQTDQGTGILAVDVHTRGVAALVRALDAAGLSNVRVAFGDAVHLLENLPPDSLAGVRAWFPDPWPKARHHKRRLVQQPTLSLIASRIRPGGTVHLATDWHDYAEQMLAVVAAEPSLQNRAGGFSPRPPWRPVTRYERTGLDAGRAVVDLIAERV